MESIQVRVLSGVPYMYNKEITILPSLKNGYYQFYDQNHPLAYSNGCVYFHRHQASIKLGRWLKSSEQVHHIDGNKYNNTLENLQILSSQEHANLHLGNRELVEYVCKFCGSEFTRNIKHAEAVYCSVPCRSASVVKDLSITKELLDELIPKHSWVVLGAMFGYSDTGIKKRAKALGCQIPVRLKRN